MNDPSMLPEQRFTRRSLRKWTAGLAITFAAGTLIFCAGCHPAFHETSDGRILPDGPGLFFPSLGQEKATIQLRYDVLYVCDPESGQPYDPSRNYTEFRAMTWYRFWPHGRVEQFGGDVGKDPIYRSIHHVDHLSAEDGEMLQRWGAGYYSVDGNKFTMEFIGLYECGLHWDQYFATINSDGSFSYVVNGYRVVFHPFNLGAMHRQPDW